MPNAVSRFVDVSLDLYAHEGTFRIQVPEDEDFERMAREFEVRGCAVEREPFDRALTVDASVI